MSAPVDVLAVLDELIDFEERHAEAEPRANHEAREARAAVAELVEADKALDAIDAELPCSPEDMPNPVDYLGRRGAAIVRRRVALARVGGAA